MALNIPMPSLDRSGLFEGLIAGNQVKDRRQQMQQQWQQHLQDLAIKQQQQQRLAEEFELAKELHPWKLQAFQQTATNKANEAPLQLDKLRAQIEAQHALAEKARRPPSSSYKPSELERIANLLAGGDPDKERELLAEGAASKYGLTPAGAEKLPEGSVPLKSLPKGLQAQENAYQIKMQANVNDARKASHDLDEMEKIINENPDMARELTFVLGNPEDKSILSNLTRKYLDKNKLAAIEKFSKYSNDFVLSAGNGLGNNFTDAKLKALQLSKMHAGNTDEANRAIINNYRVRLKPLINYGKTLKKARGKYTLPYFEENYSDESLGIRPIEDLSDEELEALAGGE
jgi:hypothetical protein